MKRQILISGLTSFLLLFSFCVHAIQLNVEFSADAIQVSPGQAPLISKMYVSKKAVRTEINQKGYRVVDIVYPEKGKRLVLYPDQKKYMEQTGLPISSLWSQKKFTTPCDGIRHVQCKKLAKEKINQIKVDKWQVERTVNGKIFKSLHWIDNQRHFAIKEIFHDGGVMELKLLGKEKLNGREVEQWQSRYTYPSGQSRFSKQWYDTQLKMVVKEELPGGFLRELRNIKVSKQDEKLFHLPADYKKLNINMNQEKINNNRRVAR